MNKGVSPKSVVAASLSAPASINKRSISTWPFPAAMNKGVAPMVFEGSSTSALASSNKRAISTWPVRASDKERCGSGVRFGLVDVSPEVDQHTHNFNTTLLSCNVQQGESIIGCSLVAVSTMLEQHTNNFRITLVLLRCTMVSL